MVIDTSLVVINTTKLVHTPQESESVQEAIETFENTILMFDLICTENEKSSLGNTLLLVIKHIIPLVPQRRNFFLSKNSSILPQVFREEPVRILLRTGARKTSVLSFYLEHA